MAKKKALYTYFSVKELELINTLILMRIERIKITRERCEPESREWKEESYLLSELACLYLRAEEVRVKTCFLDKEYKNEVGKGE